MQISQHKVVTIDYTLTDKDGVVIDTSEGDEPLAFIQGTGGIISGLETALEGHNPGDNLKVTIAPEDAYGERDEDLVQVVKTEIFNNPEQLEVGAQFEARSGDTHRVFTIMEITGNDVKIDGNHPLAGVTLNFDVTVKDVRDATTDELSHGHAHTGGHHH
jgi:FKBP-type peptidyl-prolyl cis-trans isomerase SlyD